MTRIWFCVEHGAIFICVQRQSLTLSSIYLKALQFLFQCILALFFPFILLPEQRLIFLFLCLISGNSKLLYFLWWQFFFEKKNTASAEITQATGQILQLIKEQPYLLIVLFICGSLQLFLQDTRCQGTWPAQATFWGEEAGLGHGILGPISFLLSFLPSPINVC
jgi:hypothetical protein